jgi:parallel beta-helix repeat protein
MRTITIGKREGKRKLRLKTSLTIVLALQLMVSCVAVFRIHPAYAAKTWYVNDDGGADFIKIEDAINAAAQGDTIYVYNGTYNEHLIVNQTLTITGENKQATIIDASLLNAAVIEIDANNVRISEFTIQNGYEGITVTGYNGSVISNNIIAENQFEGIAIEYCRNSTVSDNSIGHNGWDGVFIVNSSNVVLRRNAIITNNISGVKIEDSFDITLNSNTLSNNTFYGLSLENSNHASIVQNTLHMNQNAGVHILNFTSSTFYQNNFLNNTRQTRIDDLSANAWANGVEGNFWSNYNGTDFFSGPGQNDPGSDGIGDIHYIIDSNNQDMYPFMGAISFFDAGTWNSASYSINIACNSTSLSDFHLDRIERRIAFNVTGETGVGFSRITLPNVVVEGLWRYGYRVLVDGVEPLWNKWTDETSNYVYLTYAHSEHQIVIQRLETEPPIITVLSPENKTYPSKDVALTLALNKLTLWIGYSLDFQANTTIGGNTTITGLSEGTHSITVYANDTGGNMGYSDPVHFSVDTVAPVVEILAPENTTYSASSVQLTVRVNEPTAWVGYRLDAQANQTLQATSITISNLPDGMHSIKAYANDTAGNTGASETVYFTIDIEQPEPQPEPFPWIAVAVVVAVIAGLAVLIYFVKFRKKP